MIHKILYNKKILKFKDENKIIYTALLCAFVILLSILMLFVCRIFDMTKDISYLNLFLYFLIVYFGSHLLSTALLIIINKVFYNREKYFQYKIQKAKIKDLKYRISIQKAEIETLDSLLISKITNNKSDLSSFLKNLQKRHNISLIRFFAIVLSYLKLDTLDKLLDHIKNLDEKEILTLFIKALNSKNKANN